jgi:HKD family nuclease
MHLITQPGGPARLGDELCGLLGGQRGVCSRFQAAVAFARVSGVRHLVQPLSQFVARGGVARLVVGVDHRGTSVEALRLLATALGNAGELWVFHNNAASTFHPKLYLAESQELVWLICGSGNWTEGGLYTNVEVSVTVELDPSVPEDAETLDAARSLMDTLCDPRFGTARRMDETRRVGE